MQRSPSTGISLRMHCRTASEGSRGEVRLAATERELNTTQLLKSTHSNFPFTQHTAAYLKVKLERFSSVLVLVLIINSYRGVPMKIIPVHRNRSVKAFVDVRVKLQHFCSQHWLVSAQLHSPAALSSVGYILYGKIQITSDPLMVAKKYCYLAGNRTLAVQPITSHLTG